MRFVSACTLRTSASCSSVVMPGLSAMKSLPCFITRTPSAARSPPPRITASVWPLMWPWFRPIAAKRMRAAFAGAAAGCWAAAWPGRAAASAETATPVSDWRRKARRSLEFFMTARSYHRPQRAAASGRKADAPHEVEVARVRAQRREARVDAQVGEHGRALLVRALEPLEGAILLAERGMDQREVVGRHVVRARALLERLQHLERLSPLAEARTRVRERRPDVQALRELRRLLERGQRFLRHPLLFVRKTDAPARHRELGLGPAHLAELRERLVVAALEV